MGTKSKTKILNYYIKGDISRSECIEELVNIGLSEKEAREYVDSYTYC